MSYRIQRFSSTLKYSLGEIILQELQNPEFRLLSITEVSVSKDLRKAIVTISSPLENIEDVLVQLRKARGFIKRLLPKKMKLKYIPDLEFYPDQRSKSAPWASTVNEE